MKLTNLRYGSTGDEVRKLQEALNKSGYSLDVDGIFGQNTQSAVEDYQRKNGLDVDGIAGEMTQGKLYAVKPPEQTGTQENTGNTEPVQEIKPPVEAPEIPEKAAEPEPWSGGTYGPALQAALDKLLEQKDFSYSLSGDALYRQYAGEQAQRGREAMMDTMGEAAALTGGYGNSYASSAGNQAYQRALSGLGDKAAELYKLAWERYQAGQKQKQAEYDALADAYGREYEEYAALLAQYDSQRREEAEAAQQKWENDRKAAADELARQQKEAELAEKQRQHDETLAEKQREFDLKNGIGTVTGGTESAPASTPVYNSHGYSVSEIVSLQQNAGIRADGIWGAQTEAAYQAGFRPTKKKTSTAHVTSYEPVTLR